MSMLGKIVASSSIVSIFILFFLLQTSTPATIGPIGILLVFIFMYLSVLGMLTFFLLGINRLIIKFSGSLTRKRPLHGISMSRAYYFASVIALAPVMIVGMQSVGEVGVYELLLVVIFLIVACTYIAKRTN